MKMGHPGSRTSTRVFYCKMKISTPNLIILLALCLLALILTSVSMGYVQIPLLSTAQAIFFKLSGQGEHLQQMDELWRTVIFEVRLPRVLTAAVVGAGLALAGVIFQGLLLNPLADPYTLGVSSGAAFGASLVLLLNLNFLGLYTLPLFAFICGSLTLLLVIYLSSSAGGLSSNNLILSGVIVGAILSAGISLFKYLAQERVSVIIFWLMGSFASSTWPELLLTWVLLLFGFCVFMFHARDLNLICLGSRAAESLGVDTSRMRLVLLVTASLVAAICVSVSGIIGFVGLLVPHMMRSVTGPEHRRLLPVSLLAGAILLLAADTTTRTLLPAEVPIGVLTALIGGPFFCYIFRKRQMHYAAQ
ncbi:MAG: iron ABC transporter permease [Desulfohalobiaceae bacterium]